MIALAFEIKDWRARHGLTQQQAAILIGVTRESFTDWENGDHIPYPCTLRKLRMPVSAERIAEVKAATNPPPPITAAEFGPLLKKWRRRCRLTQSGAAAAFRSIGIYVVARTIWTWEKSRELPHSGRLPSVLAAITSDSTPINRKNRVCEKMVRPKPVVPSPRFAKALRAWRKARGLNQLAACTVLGLPHDQALISNWENGKAMPRKARLLRLLAIIEGGVQ